MRPIVRATAKVALQVAYRGTAVECPICEGQFRSFVSRGVNLMCPRCWSYERHRFNMLVLRRRGVLDEPGRVLHLAPDPSLVGPLRARKGPDYVTGDLQPGPLVDVALDAHALPFGDRDFALILCSHVLEHVDDDARVLGEFLRVLAPGGTALLQVPVDPRRETTHEDPDLTTAEQRTAAFGQHDHVRMYGNDVARRFERSGFDVEELRPEGQPAETQRRMGLIHGGHKRGSDVYWCTRPAS